MLMSVPMAGGVWAMVACCGVGREETLNGRAVESERRWNNSFTAMGVFVLSTW